MPRASSSKACFFAWLLRSRLCNYKARSHTLSSSHICTQHSKLNWAASITFSRIDIGPTACYNRGQSIQLCLTSHHPKCSDINRDQVKDNCEWHTDCGSFLGGGIHWDVERSVWHEICTTPPTSQVTISVCYTLLKLDNIELGSLEL